MRSSSALWLATPARYCRLLGAIALVLLLEIFYNAYTLREPYQAIPRDKPFHLSCQDPKTSTPRENATILMLARNSDLDEAVESLTSLEKTFNKHFHYPIVILNDQPWNQEFKDAMTTVVSGPLQFGLIEKNMWQYPDWIDQNKARMLMDSQAQAGVYKAGDESYHHMCRFYSGLFYDHELLQAYKWYWRVEPGVRFTCDVTYDPFVEMAKNKKKYGYIIALWELPETVPTLFHKIDQYKRMHRIPTRQVWTAMIDPSYLPWPFRSLLSRFWYRDADGNMWSLCHFWNNFEIADMDWFRSAEYRKLFAFLDADGGFYYERITNAELAIQQWGDASVRSIAAALLLGPAELHHFADFGYEHKPFRYCPYMLPNGRNPDVIKTSEEERSLIGCRCNCDGDLLFNQPTCLNRIKSA